MTRERRRGTRKRAKDWNVGHYEKVKIYIWTGIYRDGSGG